MQKDKMAYVADSKFQYILRLFNTNVDGRRSE